MNLVELLQVASSEERAEKFLRERGVLKTFDSYPFCNAENIGKVRRNFYKCYECKKEWSIRKDSILEDLKVWLSKFVLAVKLFILEVSANKAHKELDLAYNTIHKIYTKLNTMYIQICFKRWSAFIRRSRNRWKLLWRKKKR